MKRAVERLITWILILTMVVGFLPPMHLHAHAAENPYAGKTISILGDSISTYRGVSNDASVNATLKGGAIYYTPGTQGVYREDTWWQQTVDLLGMELLVNNSWSGSCVLHTRAGTVGGYVDRCVQLHNDKTGEEPDVIAVFLGTNDVSYYRSQLGTADIDYAALIRNNGDGTYTYGTPATTCEAYAIMLHKMTHRYPDAEIYCMTMLPRRRGVTPPTAFNQALTEVIRHFGATVVDLENCGITPDPANFDTYITDQRVHPGPLGMDKMTLALLHAMRGQDFAVYNISHNLANVTADTPGTILLSGNAYQTTLSVKPGFEALSVKVTMGGKDITASVCSGGKVTIPAVTGDVVITASATVNDDPDHFCWKTEGNSFVNVAETEKGYSANAVTKKAGSISDGVISNAYFQLEKPVVLRHDRPWVVEWTVSGTSWSGMLLSASATSGATGNNFLFKTTQNTGFIGFGEPASSGNYTNYGIALEKQGVKTADRHCYRVENRIASDGSNMAYLLVDGQDYGPMNNFFIGGNSDQGKQVDWLNGRDFCFSYIGSGGHSLNNCKLEYLSVWENGEADEQLHLRYDDRYDVAGKTVEIVDAGKPTSYQVGYGVAENSVKDTAVVTLSGNKLIATGIGTAKVKIDGVVHEVKVTTAPLSLLLLAGQSNMRGSEGDANQSIVCPEGMVYATYGDDRGADNTAMTASNANRFAPSALAGAYSSINAAGTTDCLSGYPVYSLTETGKGKIGPDSGFAYEWVKQTGEKVWIVNAAHGGTSISAWQPGKTEYEECQALFTACTETLRKEIAAGHFTLSHMAYFWCQGCSDRTWTAEKYVANYLAMHEGFQSELAFDHDSDPATAEKTFEMAGIIPVRVGNTVTCYRDGVNSDQNSYSYHESFVDLRMSGPRVAQYWMGSNPDLTDIHLTCTIGDDWVWMPDGTNGVSEYFNKHYTNGTVDYTTQVKQKDSWYKPTTPKAVHDTIHYNQIGYNELGRESVRNALILLGEKADYTEKTTVKFVDWTGYKEVKEIEGVSTAQSGSLIVPMVRPITRSKDVTYTLSNGLHYNYYDLTAGNGATGTLTAVGAQGSVTVTKENPGKLYRDHLSELPASYCAGTNLWTLLEHDPMYFASGKAWQVYSGRDVPSVTIPVKPGDKIFATSFGKAGENGYTSNGIRMTFFGEYSVIKTLDPAGTYAEFSKNGGYLVAPEGATAVNVPMWNNSDSNELYILNAEHTYQGGKCTVCGAAQWDTDGDGVLEILAIGNSFSVDALEYTYQIARDLGVQKVAIGNLYIGGCTLDIHAKNAADNLAKYTYYYNDNGKWTTTGNYKISTALESRSWDYVSLQQGSKYSGVESTYNDDLTNLIAYVRARSDAKLVWHMTWAYQQNSTHSAFPTYNKDQMTMYNAIVSAVKNKIVPNEAFDLIVPNGTAVQNSRTSMLGDTTTRDGYHMSYGYGRYLTGLGFIKMVTGLSIDSVTYAPSGVTAEQKAIAIESVNNAYAAPFAVTQSAYMEEIPEIPEEGYCLLQPELTRCGYWWPIDSGKYNTIVTDASNSKSFFATPRFTREELPVGSILVLEEGWQYRPEGWVTDSVQTKREDTTTAPYVAVTEEWWGNYTIRAFNISKVGLPSLANIDEAEIRAAFRIYVPEEKHVHDFHNGICILCGQNECSISGHKWSAATCETAKTCSVCKKTEGSALGHKWSAASCETAKTCSVCKKTEGSALGHKWTAATCETAKTCSVCKKTEGSALGHKWVAATCDKAKTCSVCKKTEGSALGHKWAAATCDKAKTCSVCKKTEGSALGHKWSAATCDKAKTCSVCKKTEGSALGHKWSAATCETAKTCSVCKKTEGSALGHKWSAATCDKAKTCSVCKKTEGSALGHKWAAATCDKAKTCSVCKKTEGAALGHKWVAATCDKAKTCSVCKKTEGSALGHKWSTATCETAKTCSVCKKTEGAALGHKWSAATCETAKTCSVCKKTEGTALGHKWSAATCDKAKTCSACKKTEGSALGHKWSAATCETAKTCSVCKKTEGSALGHKWTAATCDKAKTCSVCKKTEGSALGHKWSAATCDKAKTCSVCKKTEGSPKDHVWDKGTVIKPATEEVEGVMTYKCTDCGKTRTETIPMLSHTHKYEKQVTAPTCTEQGYTTYTCKCGHTYVDNYTKATGHKAVTDAAISATCTKNGLTSGSHCSVCGVVIKGQETVPATGHNWDKGTVTKPATEEAEGVMTYKCTACGETKTAAIPVLSHTHKYDKIVTAPTCTEQGYTTYTCKCGHSYVDNYTKATGHKAETDKAVAATCTKTGLTAGSHCSVCGVTIKAQEVVPATGHNWDKRTVTKPATEETEGVMTYKCVSCGETKTASIPVLSHTHKYEKQVTAPTCTEQGYTTYTCKCGHSYVDNYTKATGHKAESDKAVPATCTKTGLSAGSHCSICGVTIKAQETIPATGHNWDKGTVTKPATEEAEGIMTYKCTACGETKTASIPVLSHTHKYEKQVTVPTCTEQGYTTYTCKCGHSYVDNYTKAIGHKAETDKAVAATCTKTGLSAGSHCSVCGVTIKAQEIIPATGHNWDKGTVTKPATEEAEGIMTYKCTACGETKTASIPVLSHTHKYDKIVTAPTCTEQGYTTYTCKCGHSYVDNYIKATGHKAETDKALAATCTKTGLTAGSHCSVCGVTIKAQEVVPAIGHNWDNGTVTKPATEEAEGIMTYKCTACGETKTASIPVLSHTHKYEKQVTAPTCSEQGYTTYTCKCGHTYVDNYTKATGHKAETDKAVAATCTKTGLSAGSHCSVCGVTIKAQEVVPATGHSWDKGTVTKPATEEAEGIMTYKCTACGETKTESIPVLSHTHKYDKVVTAPTCTEQGYTTYTCKCGHTYVDNYTKATGHKAETDKAVAATCTKTGLTVGSHCSVCGVTIKAQEVVPAIGHNWDKGTVTKPATEETEGVMTYKCVSCGETKTASIPVLSHTHKYDKVVTQPTCTEQGYTTYTCKCGHSYVDNYTNAAGHKAVTDAAISATCTKTGLTDGSHCEVCGLVLKEQETIPETGHSWDKGTVTKPATEEAEGVMTFQCTVCGDSRTESIPAMEHVHKYEKETVAASCEKGGYDKFTCACGHSYTENEVEALGHQWMDATCETPKTCERCGKTEGEAAHRFEDGLCVVCGATQIVAEGEYSDKIRWTLDANGVLTVSGTGELKLELKQIPQEDPDAEPVFENVAPWADYADEIKKAVMEEGITEVGDGAFLNCVNLEEVTLPNSLKTVGAYAFADCEKLHLLTFMGDAPVFGENCFRNLVAYLVYPTGNETWTEATLETTGGSITLTDEKPLNPAIRPGDVTADGKADYSDALLILRASIGLEELTEEQQSVADVTGDNKFDYGDALLILRRSIGLE